MTEDRRPLLLIVISDDAERLRGALVLACAEAALGGSVRLFLQLDAVRLIAPPLTAPLDAKHEAEGLPGIAALFDNALELGVALIACQSGLTLAGLSAEALDARIEIGGPVGMLAASDTTERMVVV